MSDRVSLRSVCKQKLFLTFGVTCVPELIFKLCGIKKSFKKYKLYYNKHYNIILIYAKLFVDRVDTILGPYLDHDPLIYGLSHIDDIVIMHLF